MSELALASRTVVTPEGIRDAAVLVRAGVIVAVLPRRELPAGVPVRELGELALLPGLVDSHVHVNEPGRTEWEGFETATRAAAAGGITTLVDMPLNCIPVTTTLAALQEKQRAIRELLRVDVALWGGVIPGNAAELSPMAQAGAAGFKAFLVHSGIDEFPDARESDLRAAMPVLARLRRPLLVHAELQEQLREPPPGPPDRYAGFLASRPGESEEAAIRIIIGLCRATGCPVHIVHLSAAGALPLIAAAKAEGLPLTVETCPHYLTLAAEDVPDGHTEYKCAPPIRDRENRERLWEGLREGLIDLVVSDHSPCTPHLKRPQDGDFMQAWGGISSVQLTLPVVWTAARARGFTLADLARWMSAGPAKLAGLDSRKGAIAPGLDADFAVLDAAATFTVDAARLHHKHKLTPYDGRALQGVVRETILRGETLFRRDGITETFTEPLRGRLLTRGSSA